MANLEGLEGATLVTGAASGIGAAVARALVERGGSVVALDRDGPGLERLQSSLGACVVSYCVDVCDESAVDRAVAHADARLAIAGLVNAAGVLITGTLASRDFASSALSSMLAVNVQGTWLVTRAVAERMMTRKRGSIVTISSNAASVPRVGLGGYCASKAAVTMLTKCFGLELAEHGIRCNVVSPGSTDTPMLRSLLDGAEVERAIAGDPSRFRLGIPLGRVAEACDVAEAVLFLLSERSRHVALHDLRVDGGASL